MNKEPSFAGSFYPSKPEELNNLLDSYKEPKQAVFKSKAIISPHAGYLYSGHAAMSAYENFEPSENIFIFAPSHHETFTNIAMPEYTYFDTPLGSIEVNNRLIKEIAAKYPCIISNAPFEQEHAIEVQLPFLQNIFSPRKQSAIDFVKNLNKIGKKLRIVPILIGRCDYRLISDIITEYWDTSSFIISSDVYPVTDSITGVAVYRMSKVIS
jgi:predicted class III extradiol MEMO1 family dioxygenase